MVKKKKEYVIVAYDIADDRRRYKVVKVLERLGVRVNFSVFECMLTKSQMEKMKAALEKVICPKEDSLIFYPICLSCYTKIEYIPKKKPEKIERVVVL
jgi:CRISPR-associated protein Cas2